jgi:hypothetical protein
MTLRTFHSGGTVDYESTTVEFNSDLDGIVQLIQ